LKKQEETMKRISFMLLVILVVGAALVLALCITQQSVSAEKSNKVLLMLRERIGSADEQYMITNEAVMMKRILEDAGLTVVIASASDRKIITSAYCPGRGSDRDQTAELIQALIAELQIAGSEEPVVIFAIGQEDKSYSEFRLRGFKGQSEYTCRVGVDCSSEAFPRRLYRASIPGYNTEDSGVERVTIMFTLDQAYKNAVLRLARAGNETTVVTVDGEQERTHRVTDTMLESGDGYVSGVYNLTLGALKKGLTRFN
jgi:hypothetical protein